MAGNAKYTSLTIQNQILEIVITMVVEEIVIEANESFLSALTMNPSMTFTKKTFTIFP